ncbi:ABC transporter permease [Streptomyces sp. NBC_01304]|uniref:ABC transporter permease n=1 Tax=Streptomyces sp. NBC_01304 TaxID=2903818 RepID=UPI002E0EA010|nr:ABC transporter permease [Streptomyces sp. NBC_01304]
MKQEATVEAKAMKREITKERVILALAAPVLALVVAVALTSVILLATGKNPFEPYSLMVSYVSEWPDVQVLVINQAVTYYLAALAVAVGFRMNLFNIGVEGQYRLGACVGAIVGFNLPAPGVVKMIAVIVTAVVVGALWAGVAALLKVTRGVSEVIATIMLNSVAAAIIGYLIQKDVFGHQPKGANGLNTGDLPESAWFPGIPYGDFEVFGFLVIAVLLGVGYWVMLNRTRFGFDLRAAGASESAALASGVSGRKMVLIAMLASGALAGLIGMPSLLGESHTFMSDFPAGYGFTGIAIALLGRNHPLGMAFGAFLWAFLDKASTTLDDNGYESEISVIMQGIIVLAVVIAYESVQRWGLKRQQQKVGAELAAAAKKNSAEKVTA